MMHCMSLEVPVTAKESLHKDNDHNYLEREGKQMTGTEELAQRVLEGDEPGVRAQVNSLLSEGYDPRLIISDGLIGGMNIVAPLFKSGEMYVPEVLIAARAMKAGMEIIKPLIAEVDIPKVGKIVIGTVKGDLHDIGKNLVSMMLEGAGFEVVDLGINISPDTFIKAIKQEQPDIVAMSALLTSTMPVMKETIEAFEQAGVRQNCKVIIGGAPVTNEFADEIGADGFAADGASASDLCRKLCSI